MKLQLTSPRLPVAAPAEHLAISHLLSRACPRVSVTALKAPLVIKRANEDRKFASLTAHRVQCLAQRRAAVPSSAKRW
ncbi:hypothetical protein GCM10022408_30780 [Hymenobacter fastidiosus]|uniref:Uncharacterized protein n=1 Tax=Hymenobacter fastidiosus TaxID=486264 RepID=A0ABP7SRM7_9BACT